MSHKYVIFLTACVNPDGMANTLHTDCRQRAEEYKKALCFYLQKTKLSIVFCENTLCDMSYEFSSYIASGRLEYLTFDGNHYNKKRGKGVGEVEIMEYAFLHSKLLQNGDHIIKITGRLKVLNIRLLIAVRRVFGDDYIQLRINKDGTFAHSQFFIAPVLFLRRYFIPLGRYIDDRDYIYFEHMLGRAVKEQNEYYLLPLFDIPLISGISGTNAQPYQSSFSIYERLQCIRWTLAENLRFNKRYALERLPFMNEFVVRLYWSIIIFFVLVFRLIIRK